MNMLTLLRFMIVRNSSLPNYLEARLTLSSGLNIQEWRNKLVDFPDLQLINFLEFGWLLDYASSKTPTLTLVNHTREADRNVHINNCIQKECELGAMLGLFKVAPFEPWCQVSPLMTRPKKNSTS